MSGNCSMLEPLITIITVSYNCKTEIEKTIMSVLKQDDLLYEYIVIDGASTDGTIEIVKNYSKIYRDKFKLISEKDHGIYDAMNKGIKLAKGKYIIFLNANDCLCKNALKVIANNIAQYPETDILYGNSISEYVYSNEIIYRYKIANVNISLKTLREGMGCVHQCMVTRKTLLENLDGFRAEFKVGADWDFLIRAVSCNVRLKYCNFPFCVYNRDGVSANSHLKERHIIRKANFRDMRFDKNYIKDYFCIADILKRCIGYKGYLYFERKKNQKYKQESQLVKERYIQIS